MPSLSTVEYSFRELEKKQKGGWRTKEEGSALLSGSIRAGSISSGCACS